MQTAIPFMQFRGGSSKGIYFKAEDLPKQETERNLLVLAALEGAGIGDPRQIDGLGGGTTLTSKVAVVSLSASPDADLDYLFLQVVVGKGMVTAAQNCGNILAGVLPFAIESGLMKAADPTTSARINMINTGGICEVVVQTPHREMNYQGDATVDGVMGTAAPVICNYLDTVGSTCGDLLPTGNAVDFIHGIEATCIDNGMPVIMMRANDFGLSGYESKEDLEKNEPLKQQIEQIRLEGGRMMKLGDVSRQTIPKVCLVSTPHQGGVLNTRMFIPHVVHDAIGVLAAVSVATACVVPGTVVKGIAQLNEDKNLFSIEHPSGEFTVKLEYQFHDGKIAILKLGVIRTARLLSKGELFIPAP